MAAVIMRTRVRFKDGTESVTEWTGEISPASALTRAAGIATWEHGEDHDGAWLEFASGEEQP